MSLHVKECTLTIFLDIEGAFSNVNSNAIARALDILNLNQNLVRFTELFLKSRIITSTVRASKKRIVCRGILRCGSLPPLIWNLAVSSLLRKIKYSGNNVIADITITASGIG